MRKMTLICIVLIMMTACAVSKKEVEQLNKRLTELEDRMMLINVENNIAQSDMIVNQFRTLNNRVNAIESATVQRPQQTATPVVNIPGSIADEEITKIYNEGRTHYESRNYPAAIRSFTLVTTQAPTHDLAANSLYWIGESYYALADFSAARLAFQKLQDNYPNSNKFIDAQVKIAMTWIRQNRKDQARRILEAIKRDFPNYERMPIVDQNLRLTR